MKFRVAGIDINVYMIRRDHSRGCGFYHVNVVEAHHRGLGMQTPVGPWVIGVSIGRFPRYVPPYPMDD